MNDEAEILMLSGQLLSDQTEQMNAALEWHPIAELPAPAHLSEYIELRGPNVSPCIIRNGWCHAFGYTHWRKVLPGPEGCL